MSTVPAGDLDLEYNNPSGLWLFDYLSQSKKPLGMGALTKRDFEKQYYGLVLVIILFVNYDKSVHSTRNKYKFVLTRITLILR